jgi:hypothetical protein
MHNKMISNGPNRVVLHSTRLERYVRDKLSSLLDPYIVYKIASGSGLLDPVLENTLSKYKRGIAALKVKRIG